MKSSSYDLPVTPASRQENGGVYNKAFHVDNVTNNSKEESHTEDSKKHKEKDAHLKGNDDTGCDNDDPHCGIGSCKPKAMQRCQNMACFSALYCIIGLTTSALSSYINSQITTLEKHFNLSSAISGFLMSCNDLGYLSTTLFMSYYTRRVHIPRALAICSILYGISGLICTMAFFGTRDQIPSPPSDDDYVFTGGKASVQRSASAGFTQMCENLTKPANASCEGDSKKNRASFEISEDWRMVAVCVIAGGMILQGIAKSPRHAFLGTFVDDNVPKTKTTMYLGVMTGLSIFGPALAFALGGVFSNMYVTLEETSISPRDPRWIGAWWLGFLVFGGAGLVVGLPLMFFPKRLVKKKVQQTVKEKSRVDKKGLNRFWHDIKDLLRSVFQLILNPVYMCMVFASGINIMAVSGMMAFSAKYMETQFTVTASKANILIGAMKVLAAPTGAVIGGCVTSRLKLSPRACLVVITVSKILATSFSCLGLVLGCDQPTLYTGGDSQSGGSISQCQQDCNCDDTNYFPICGNDGNSYFSPCHAGCMFVNHELFTNCSCLTINETQTATGGLCTQDCNNMYPYLCVNFLGAFFSTVIIMPSFIVIVRSVTEVNKPLAIGLNAFASTLIGWFPGPVIYGFLVDSTCLLWKTTCSSVGACSLYDIELFRFRYHALSIGLRAITISLYIIALVYTFCSKNFTFQPHRDEVCLAVPVDQQDNEMDSKNIESSSKVKSDKENINLTSI
ncbi:unnamed protein product [Candidula unifasciata]|uniref:Solute carrier organic anion transporter family member n=1 Tax=Candidula unifasciata TaxID=100452 RepID=A0A8S3ZKT3_9EUPU|nr:unnamed protein product [Candidula unifasciata]